MEEVNFYKEADDFKILFNEIEDLLRKRCEQRSVRGYYQYMPYSECISKLLISKDMLIKHYKNELEEIGELRNYMMHNSTRNYAYPVYPSPEYNELLRTIIGEIKQPKTIYNSKMCVRNDGHMLWASLTDNVQDTVRKMLEKVYTQVPILEDGRMVGVFSESSLIEMFKEGNDIANDPHVRFENILEYIDIDRERILEDFGVIDKDSSTYEVEEFFKRAFDSDKRITCLFITENGKKTEKILGLTTIWDVLGKHE